MNEQAFRYDPFDARVMEAPLAFYGRLRDESPVLFLEQYDTFVFSRFDDVAELLSVPGDALLATENTLPPPEVLLKHNDGAPPRPGTQAPLAMAGALGSPWYGSLRRAHIKPLLPSGVAALTDFTRRLARERLDELLPKGRFDLTLDYGGAVAASVMCDMYGLPLDRAREVLELVNSLTVSDPEKGGVSLDALIGTLIAMLVPLVAKRREAGADGSRPLIDGLIDHRVDRDGRALDDAEIAIQLICVFVGGNETVPKIAADGLLELANRPDQLAQVRADLERNVPIAVEEIIRFCAPAQWFVRTANEEVTIAGQKVRPGQRVMALYGSAARDPREFDRPDEFIWNRTIKRVLSFGLGRHHCIGAHLARMELRVLIEEFLKRVPRYSFDMAHARRYPSSFQWGWNSLPVVIG